MYNWQLPGWPQFQYDSSALEESLIQFAQTEGMLRGMLDASSQLQELTPSTELMIAEVLTNAAIEGEYLNRTDVRSSINNKLGINKTPEHIKDLRAKGMAIGLLEVRSGYDEVLSKEVLFGWHATIMEPYSNINAGQWRSSAETMRILSGSIGKETVHFEAPPSTQINGMMGQFIDWYNAFLPSQNRIIAAPIFAAIAHLYFESIHPFEDGNGRIGRMLAIKALSQGLGYSTYLGLSKAILQNRQQYYDQLKIAQGTLDISEWIHYFVETILEAQDLSIKTINAVLQKSKYMDHWKPQINPRQQKVLNKMLDAEPEGFEGGISAKKYMSMTKSSKATATRDLQELLKMGAIQVIGAGRSTRYALRFWN